MDGWNEKDYEITALSSGVMEDPQAPYGEGKKGSRIEFIRQLKLRTKVAAAEIVNLTERTASSPALNLIYSRRVSESW